MLILQNTMIFVKGAISRKGKLTAPDFLIGRIHDRRNTLDAKIRFFVKQKCFRAGL